MGTLSEETVSSLLLSLFLFLVIHSTLGQVFSPRLLFSPLPLCVFRPAGELARLQAKGYRERENSRKLAFWKGGGGVSKGALAWALALTSASVYLRQMFFFFLPFTFLFFDFKVFHVT